VSILVSAVGDLHVNRSDPGGAFAGVAGLLAGSDVVFGNLEAVYSDRPGDGTGPIRRDPRNLAAIRAAGFSVLSLANNVALGGDRRDLEESIAAVERLGMRVVGAARTLPEAGRVAVIERAGVRVGFLAYTCVGPAGSSVTVEELDSQAVAAPDRLPVSALAPDDPASTDLLAAAVAAARPGVDALLVSIHWGVLLVPAKIAAYERRLARAAIDAGADVVFGHHQHILKGIDAYRGRPIVHGAGNFVLDGDVGEVERRAPKPAADYGSPEDPYAFGFRAEHPTYPFHPESLMTAVFQFRAGPQGAFEPALVPCLINHGGEPLPLSPGQEAFERWLEYLRTISAAAGLEAGLHVRRDGRVGIESEG
jgi:Bacterial capsule synthesis protein PGA_cap